MPMPIRFECPNGHTLYAKETQVGKAYACPKCGESVRVPAPPKPQIEVVALPEKLEPKKPIWTQNMVILGALAGALTVALLACIPFLFRSSKNSQASQQAAKSTDPSSKKS